MPQQLKFLIRMLEEMYNGHPWHGESICTKLADVDHHQAMERPVPGVHTIYELVGHMLAWRNYVVRKLKGDLFFKIESDKDWHFSSDTSPSSWEKLKQRLYENQQLLIEEMKNIDPEQFTHTVPGTEDLTFERMLHGLIQHDVYHLGQIGLVKKLASKRVASP